MEDDREPARTGHTVTGSPPPEPPKELSTAAERALAEAAERRRARARAQSDPPRELGGQPGPDPTRYGDWEKGGIVTDF